MGAATRGQCWATYGGSPPGEAKAGPEHSDCAGRLKSGYLPWGPGCILSASLPGSELSEPPVPGHPELDVPTLFSGAQLRFRATSMSSSSGSVLISHRVTRQLRSASSQSHACTCGRSSLSHGISPNLHARSSPASGVR